MELEKCRLDGGPVCRSGGCSCFKQVREGQTIRIVGTELEFPSQVACAAYLNVSQKTISRWVIDGLKHGEIQLEVVENG